MCVCVCVNFRQLHSSYISFALISAMSILSNTFGSLVVSPGREDVLVFGRDLMSEWMEGEKGEGERYRRNGYWHIVDEKNVKVRSFRREKINLDRTVNWWCCKSAIELSKYFKQERERERERERNWEQNKHKASNTGTNIEKPRRRRNKKERKKERKKTKKKLQNSTLP